MKEIIKNNKGFLIIFIGIILLIVMAIILISNKNHKTFYMSEISSQFTNYYSDDNLQELEKENIDSYFSLPSSEMTDAILLSNFDPNNLVIEEESYSPKLLLVISNIDKDKVKEYYESLNAFVISYTSSDRVNEELISLYKNSILKDGSNYIYFIMGDDSKIMERELLSLYK